MKEKIIKLIAKTLDINPKDINEKTNLVKDLEVESLDLVDLVAAFEDEFGIEIADKDIKNIQTVGDIIKYAEEHKAN